MTTLDVSIGFLNANPIELVCTTQEHGLRMVVVHRLSLQIGA